MGDRCTVWFWVRKDQGKEFLREILEGMANEEEELENGWAFTINEAHGGLYDARKVAAERGFVFVGEHGVGQEYGAFRFYADGDGKLREFETSWPNQEGVVIYPHGPAGRSGKDAMLHMAEVLRGYDEWRRLYAQFTAEAPLSQFPG